MKRKQFYLLVIISSFATLNSMAQTNAMHVENSSPKPHQIKDKSEHDLNFIKVNLTAIALKNYSIQYERVINKGISVAVSFRTMPSTTLPFKNQLLKAIEDDPEAEEVIETFELSNFAITPEVRFYVGKKGYGRGFYIAPFYRYAKFKTNRLLFTYGDTGNDNSINLSGDLAAHTGGLMFGAQWALGRRVCLDWWILGPHYGSGKGNFAGISAQPLSQDEQDDLRQELEDFDLPLTDKTVSVNASGASVNLDGPWGGVRAGISIGIKF